MTRLYDASRIAFHQVKEQVSHQYKVPTFGLVTLPVRARGATRTRTEDPLLAKQVLYQLSYNPHESAVAWQAGRRLIRVGLGGVEPPTSRLSGVRSNHLSYSPIYFTSRK